MKTNFLKNKFEQKTKRVDLKTEIEVPSGMTLKKENNQIFLKKGEIELSRELNPLIHITIEDNKFIIESKKATKRNKKIFGSFEAHIKNMIRGLDKGFLYRLQVANVHFPMTVSYDKSKHEIVVKNFLGEKTDRRISLVQGVEVKIEKDIIELRSENKEIAGQSAANIEKGTKVINKDRRIYQDGIYIIEKPGRELL